MGSAGERCPQCAEPVGRFDYQCPRCELVLPKRKASPTQERREVSVVRAMIEQPRAEATVAVKPKRRPTHEGPLTAERSLVPMDRVLQVTAPLRLQSLNLHEYEAWVISLIDGKSTGQMLAEKLALSEPELQVLLQSLIDRGALTAGKQRAHVPQRRAEPESPTRDFQSPISDPTQILDRAALLGETSATLPRAPAARPPPPPPPPPTAAGRKLTGKRPSLDELVKTAPERPRPKLHDLDDEESTVTAAGPQTSDRTVAVPAPDLDTEDAPLLSAAPTPRQAPDNRPTQLKRMPTPPGGTARPASRPTPAPQPRAKVPTPPPERPVSAPGYRPPKPAAASKQVPKPTVGIEDVDAQGALQVALQMEQGGRFEEAVGYLERAISRSPDAAPLYNRLAVILMRDFEDFVRAEQLLLQALELAPGHAVFTRNLDTVRKRQRDARRGRR